MTLRLAAFTLSFTLLGACAPKTSTSYIYACGPDGYDRTALMDMKNNGFEIADDTARNDLALDLVDCLRDTDPDIRDGVAYTGLTNWMRGEKLDADTLHALWDALDKVMAGDDPAGVAAPFAALVLSEVTRTDRVTSYMTNDERGRMVESATTYIQSVSDYRGFDDTDGWRHGVAHGSDWLLQLVLNPKLDKPHLTRIRNAVGTQVQAAKGHAYIHGEADRLARPIVFMARRDVFSEEEWAEWLADVSSPAPLDSWNNAFTSEGNLARLHNTKAFFYALYVNADASANEDVKTLLPGTLEVLRTLP